MKRYSVVLEKGEKNWGAYSPDVPGCFAVGDTVEEVRQRFVSALEFHFEGMRLNGERIAEPSTQVEYVEVAA
jgi:predicted RNase H-like HicB family nuclease